MRVFLIASALLFNLLAVFLAFKGESFGTSSVMALLCLILAKLYEKEGGGES